MTAPEDRFASTEAYYADHRPGYGPETVEYLVERFALDGGSRVLDLGCGTGQLAVPLAAHAGEVVGMDPSEAMLAHARERARSAGRENVEWVVGSDADLPAAGSGGDLPVVEEVAGVDAESDAGSGVTLDPLQLTTMGRSFHWMDQPRTLDRLYSLTAPGGGVAVVNDREWLTRGRAEWQRAAFSVVEEYVDGVERREGPTEAELANPWDELVARQGFDDVDVRTVEFHREWDPDGIVGYVLSLSFCSPAVLGEDRAAFEADLRERLSAFDSFGQDVAVEVIAGKK